MKDIDGKEVDLAKKYQGKVVMLVNVASKCGTRRNTMALRSCMRNTSARGCASSACRPEQISAPGTGRRIGIKHSAQQVRREVRHVSKVSVKATTFVRVTSSSRQRHESANGGDVKWNLRSSSSQRRQGCWTLPVKTKPDDAGITQDHRSELASKLATLRRSVRR